MRIPPVWLMVAVVLVVVWIAGCSQSTTRSCTWTAPDGTQHSVVAIESKSTEADVATIEALAGIVRGVVIGGTTGALRAETRDMPRPQPLPDLCARMFRQ